MRDSTATAAPRPTGVRHGGLGAFLSIHVWSMTGVALALLLGAGRASAQFLSPGPLSKEHAHLEGDDKCESCHAAGRTVATEKCNVCHEPIGRAQAAGRGLHGRTFKGQPCGKCHTEHQGRDFALIRWNPKALNHADTGWPLQGAHVSAKCESCHKTKTFLGLSTECTSCHKDAHEGRFGERCASCHQESSWKAVDLSVFDHNKARFALRGAHIKVDCVGCHGKPAKYRGLEFSACTSCHQDPHRGQMGRTCTSCHTEQDWHVTNLGPAGHPWLSLAHGHSKTPCTKCHDRGAAQPPSRGKECVNCHQPVHQANFGRQCQSCHDSILWLGLARPIGIAAHGKTPYPLKGKHEEAPCAGCHLPNLPRNRRYRELAFDRCDRCHSDAHGARFARRDRGECTPCHTEKGFRPSAFGVTLHATTTFPLLGHHVAVACGSCHDNHARGARRLDWSNKKAQCADCHQNPHGDQFAEKMRENGCASCHSPADWNMPKINHDTWPLTGAHASAACGSCHSATETDRKAGHGPSFRQAPRECAGCHDDVHRGQFRLAAPVRACSDCHETTKFAITTFQHAKLTGYALEGRHQTLLCKQCHAEHTTPSGQKAVRYRLGYRRCRDCHADPHADARPEPGPEDGAHRPVAEMTLGWDEFLFEPALLAFLQAEGPT